MSVRRRQSASPHRTDHGGVRALDRPLARFMAPMPGARSLTVDSQFDLAEGGVLQRWAERLGIVDRGPPPAMPQPDTVPRGAAFLAHELVKTAIRLGTPRGEATLEALQELHFLTPFSAWFMRALDRMHGRAGGEPPLRDVHFIYNGHTTEAMFPLFPTLGALGLSSGTVLASPYSGTGGMYSVMEEQLPEGRVVRVPLEGPEEDLAAHERLAAQEICHQAEQAALLGKVVVVDKGGPVARNLTPRLRELIAAGTLRFVVHNSDDAQALEPLSDIAYMVDVRASPLKALEARVVGEMFAFFGARELRRELEGATVMETPITVVGFGLLGEAIADALVRFGIPPSRIEVLDDDPAARARAEERYGFRSRPNDGQRAEPFPDQALVFVATPGAGLTPENARAFGRKSVVLAVTSGGKGVDVAGLEKAAVDSERRDRHGGGGFGRTAAEAAKFPHLVARFGDGTGEDAVELIVPALGRPLNLLEENWPDRFSVTAAVVAAGVCEVAKLDPKRDAPGLYKMKPGLQEEARVEYEASGLLSPRPLSPYSYDYVRDMALEEDFRSFPALRDVVLEEPRTR